MRYNQFLKAKRISDSKKLTLKGVDEELDVSVSYVSDIEQVSWKPYDEAKSLKIIEFYKLTEDGIVFKISRPKRTRRFTGTWTIS